MSIQLSYQLRTKAYKNEDGEYSDSVPTGKEQVDSIIDSHWNTDTAPNGLETILVSNNINQHLILVHAQSNVFEVYFVQSEQDHYYHKKSSIEILFASLELFFNHDTIDLCNLLNRKIEEIRYVKETLLGADFNYRYSNRRGMSEGAWMIYSLPVGLMVICVPFLVPVTNALLIACGANLGLLLWLGLFLHIQYKRDIGNHSIRLTRGNEKILVKSSWQSKTFLKSEVSKVTKYRNPASQNPWGHYGFIEIQFKSGEIVNVTNLLCDQLFILEKFEHDDMEIKQVKSRFPRIKNKTKITF